MSSLRNTHLPIEKLISIATSREYLNASSHSGSLHMAGRVGTCRPYFAAS